MAALEITVVAICAVVLLIALVNYIVWYVRFRGSDNKPDLW